MAENLLLGHQDIPENSTSQNSSSSLTDGKNLVVGGRSDAGEFATAGKDEYIEYGNTTGRSSDYLSIIGAKGLQNNHCTSVTLKGSDQLRSVVSGTSNLTAHFHGEAGVTADSDMLVSAWSDQSGNVNDFAQSTDSLKPHWTRADNRENRVPSSDDFSAWTTTRSSVLDDQIISLQTNRKKLALLTEDSSTNTHFIAQTVSDGVVNGIAYTFSAVLKKSEQHVSIRLHSSTDDLTTHYNLTTGAVDSQSGTSHTDTITSLGDDQYKVTITWTSQQTGDLEAEFYLANVPANTSYTGDGSSGAWIGEAQLYEDAADDVYIPNTSTSYGIYRGMNGHRCLHFLGGATNYLESSSQPEAFFDNDAKHAFIVFATEITNSTDYIFDLNDTVLRVRSDSRFVAQNDDGSTDSAGNSNTNITALNGFIGEMTHDGVTLSAIVNDGTAATTSSGNTSVMTGVTRLGADLGTITFAFHGKIAELITFDSVLSSDDRNAVYEYLNAKYLRTPAANLSTFDELTLQGPNEEDYLTTFSTTTAYKYWWLDFHTDGVNTSKFYHYKHYFGTILDLGRDPVFPANITLEYKNNQFKPKRVVSLTWRDIADAKKQTLFEKIGKKASSQGVVLYDAGGHIFHGDTLIFARLTSLNTVILPHENWNITATFEELV